MDSNAIWTDFLAAFRALPVATQRETRRRLETAGGSLRGGVLRFARHNGGRHPLATGV